MANTIKLKRSSNAGITPDSGDLVQGELAINTADEKLYIKNSSGNIVEVGGSATTFTSSTVAPSSPSDGEHWFDSSSGTLYVRLDNAWLDVSTAAAGGSGSGLSYWTEDSSGHLIPNTDNTYDIGSSTKKVRDIFLSGSTINLGDKSISADADGIKMPAIKLGTGTNTQVISADADGIKMPAVKIGIGSDAVKLTVSSGSLIQTSTVGGVVQSPVSYDTSDEVDTKIANLVDSAPSTLNTLNELAIAVQNAEESDVITALTTVVGTKANQSTTYTKTEVYTKAEVDAAIPTSFAPVGAEVNVQSDWNITDAALDTYIANKPTVPTSFAPVGAEVNVQSDWNVTDAALDTYIANKPTSDIATGVAHAGSAHAPSDANYYVHPTGDGNLHVPVTSTTNLGKVLTAGATAGSLTWEISSGANVISSDTPPGSPSSGDLWFDSSDMQLSIYYGDTDSSQWVGTSPIVSDGTGGATTPSISGGNVVYYDDEQTFTTSGTLTVQDGPAIVDIMVVSGGGSGGSGGWSGGAGGGAGGMYYHQSMSIASGSYAVVIGAGGTADTGSHTNGHPGFASSIVALGISPDGGGEGGGTYGWVTTAGHKAGDGGSGGGGARKIGIPGVTTATGPYEFGNDGGGSTVGDLYWMGSGGGGAGTAAYPTTATSPQEGGSDVGGTAGSGKAITIRKNSSGFITEHFAGGGGAATVTAGIGGGGDINTSGLINTGGGGGGKTTSSNGASHGGSGIVIVRLS
jgi:hypothetical protein